MADATASTLVDLRTPVAVAGVPRSVAASPDGKRIIGAVFLELDARKQLLPVLLRWPGSEASGETVLLRAEGPDQIVFLTPGPQGSAGPVRRVLRSHNPALLGSRADDHVLDGTPFDAGPRDGLAHRMAGEYRRLGVVESPTEGLADGRTGDGDDDGFTHEGFLEMKKTRRTGPF